MNKIHIDRLKLIRPYIKFNYNINEIKKGNLSDYDKRKIKKYFDIVNDMQAQPHYVYRPRSKANLNQALEYANQPELKGFKAALIPTPEFGAKPTIRHTKKGMTVSNSNHITSTSHLFNKKALANNPEKEINRVLKLFPEKYKRFSAMCHVYQHRVAYSRNKTTEVVIRELINKYDNKEKNNYWEKWLNGIYGFSFNQQSEFNEYRNELKAAKDKQARDRKNAKRRAKNRKNK